MHLLQSGVDITVIALWLGHEDTATTHMYVEADLAMKEQALMKLQPSAAVPGRFRASDNLMSFLQSLCLCEVYGGGSGATTGPAVGTCAYSGAPHTCAGARSTA